MGFSGKPRGVTDNTPSDSSLPPSLAYLVGDAEVVAVWLNELGGLTFRVGADRYLKWSPAGSGLPLADEAARLHWASSYATVPRVLDAGATDDGDWLLTEALDGENAVSERWRRDPRTAARAIGEGLRRLHEALPVDGCPFDWSVADRVGRMGDPSLHLSSEPSIDKLVVCHGDACAPNTLIDDHGRFRGHVDLGRLGVADRLADLAVATYSLGWNYGDGFEGDLLDAYGIEADAERTTFYRALWDAT